MLWATTHLATKLLRVHTMQQRQKMKATPAATKVRGCIKTILRYIGEDPAREGLLDTPDRVVRAMA